LYLIAEPEPGSKVRLKFFIEQRLIDRAYQKLYQQLSNRGDIRGFRKGKVPPWRIRRQYGEDVVDGAVFGDVVEQALRSLLAHGDIQPVEAADFEEEEEERRAVAGQALVTEAVVRVRPEARIPDYQGIEIEVPDTEPMEEQIEEGIRDLRDAAAEVVEVKDREVREGDLVEATLRTTVEGEEDEEERDEAFIVGEGRYDPALDQHLLGHKVGETVEFTVDYPDRLTMGDLAGTTVRMAATINVISERHLPEVNDEFAGEAAEVSSVDELREKVAGQVRERNEDLARRVLRNGVARWLVDHVRIDLPESITQGSALEEVGEELGGEAEEIDTAEIVRLALACDAVLADRGVGIDEEDIRREYVEAGQRHGLDEEDLLKDEIGEEVSQLLRERVMREKAIDLVAEGATRKVVPLSQFLAEEDEGEEAEAETTAEDGAEGSEVPTEEQENEQSD
jgi:trigger factor